MFNHELPITDYAHNPSISPINILFYFIINVKAIQLYLVINFIYLVKVVILMWYPMSLFGG
jgi:hypothetical protein